MTVSSKSDDGRSHHGAGGAHTPGPRRGDAVVVYGEQLHPVYVTRGRAVISRGTFHGYTKTHAIWIDDSGVAKRLPLRAIGQIKVRCDRADAGQRGRPPCGGAAGFAQALAAHSRRQAQGK